ncbi:MAG: PASTA domain-containing protein [Longimicrobiales bacterium]
MKEHVRVAVPARPRKSALFWVGVALGLFAVGYLTAVFVLFPPLPVPEDGISVPNVLGQDVEGARQRLQPLRLEVGDTVSFPHAQVPAGQVVAQSPLNGQQLRAGDRVSLGLSSGPPAVVVPDVVGMGARRAENLLERLGFNVNQTTETSDRPNGTVIRSSPQAGSRQSLPARVHITVSAARPDSVQLDTTVRRDTLRKP